jgi:hypothetical protein
MPISRILRFAIFPDTNCLLNREGPTLISSTFAETYDSLAKQGDINLILSRVVRDELLARKKAQSKAYAEEVRSTTQKLRTITGAELPSIPNDEEVFESIDLKFATWCLERKVDIIEVPIEAIEWRKIVDDAINRAPPFEAIKYNEKSTEKGFRDRLILETLLFFDLTAFDWIFFVTADQLLIKAAALAFEDRPKVRIVKTIGECANQIELRRNEKVDEFINALKPDQIFYSEDDPKCLWVEFRLAHSYRQELDAQLEKTVGMSVGAYDGALVFGANSLVAPIGRERIFLGDSIIEEVPKETGDLSRWKTEVFVVSAFPVDPERSTSQLHEKFAFRLKATVVFKWTARIENNGLLHDAKLSNVWIAAYNWEARPLESLRSGELPSVITQPPRREITFDPRLEGSE